MERTKAALALALSLDLATRLLGCRVHVRRRPAGDTAREILDQPPRPLRGKDDGTATVPVPHW
ncbi:hypothetical protein L1856_01735 [Streptomyces sp. Tue 6430]|nr:hypothetical protein [Streptomyces sp. Tue 6430]